MKIDGVQIQKAYNAYAGNAADTSADSKHKPQAALDSDLSDVQADRVEISSRAVHMSDAQKMASKVTNDEDQTSREEKVARLKSLVESGEYSVSSRDVARSILVGTFFDKKV